MRELGSLLVGIAGIVVAVVMGLYVRALTARETSERQQHEDIKELTSRLARIEGVVDAQAPFFASIQSHVIDLLHHPDVGSERFDLLLERRKAKTLTVAERAELDALLTDLAADATNDHDAKAAALLQTLMPIVDDEALRHVAASDAKALEPVRPTTSAQPRKYVRQADVALTEMAALALDTNEKVTAIQAAQKEANGTTHSGGTKEAA
jgi:hypothetical protein